MDQYNRKNVQIEPFFDIIINAFKKLLFAVIKGVLSPLIKIMRKLAKIIVDFIANKVLRPIFRPIGEALKILVAPLKPIFAFIGKILDFIVTIIKFVASIIDMLLSLPFRILGGMGFIDFPPKPDEKLKNVGSLPAITQLNNTLSSVNSTFTDSASKAHQVVNRPNLIIFLTIIVLSIIFITMYFFYEEFESLTDNVIKFIMKILKTGSTSEE